MSPPIGSGMSEREYEARKRARDGLVEDLIKHGRVDPEKAREVADKTARETDNKQRAVGKKPAGDRPNKKQE